MRRSEKGISNLAYDEPEDFSESNTTMSSVGNGHNVVFPAPAPAVVELDAASVSSSDPDEKADYHNGPSLKLERKPSGKGEAITYSWKNINASTGPAKSAAGGDGDVEKGGCFKKKKKAESKDILKNVTGVARPFELLAIMGASGAGKTTLLNVLTFRNTKGLNISGERCVNGQKLSREMLSSVSAYVQQDDLFIGTMTVREHLVFQARLRMHKHIPMPERMKRVDEVLQELGLAKCQNTLIGIPGRIKGISGGEMKRLSFASEVLTDPPLMFCDEPTSGLDSYMAQNVVDVLKQLADKGKTIICTIHQPSSQVYAMFDRILLMAEGRTAYLGDARDALGFFQSAGYACPTNFNPADFFIQKLAIQTSNPEECRQTVAKICDSYDSSPAAANVLEAVEDSKKSGADLSHIALSNRSPYKASWWNQFTAVMWRSWITMLKDPMLFKIRLVITCFTAVLFGIIYLRQDLNQEGIMNMNGALFLFLTNMTFQNVFAVVNVFCAELPVFLREHFNGMYRTDVYYLGKTLTELPVFIIIPFVFATIVYWMIGFNSDVDRYLICCAIVILISNVASSFGYMISCVCPSLNAALSVGPVLIIPFMLFGGFFLNNDSVPVYFIWLKYISWFLYGNEALAINQWQGLTDIECNRPNNSTCVTDGDTVLENLNFNPDNLGFDIAMLVVLLVFFRVAAFLGLLRRTYVSK